MAGHTKGPWRVETTEAWLWIGTPKADSSKVADVVVSLDYGKGYRREFYQRQEANARLIAAAPCLLDALDPEAVDIAADLFQEAGKHSVAKVMRGLAGRQRAAIAKATQP